MKIKKGDKIYPIITGEDVLVTKGFSIENDLKSFPTVDDVLDKHQKDLDKLKSNVKYLYSYGGVGGSGSGGNGTSTGKEPSLYITLGGYQLHQSGGSTIVLSGPGEYTVEGNVRNSEGNTFYIKVACGTDISLSKFYKLNEDNQCKYKQTFNIKTNGEVIVEFYNSNYETLLQIRQQYIVNPHIFNVKFKYKYDNGNQEAEFGSSNEYFIGSTTQTDPYIDISYKIDVPNVSNVSVYYKVGDTDAPEGTNTKDYGTTTDISNNHLKISLNALKRNGIPFLDDRNTGVYDVDVKLNYSSNGLPVVSEFHFKITLIPNHLYINVRNPENVLYDTLDELTASMVDGIPKKYIYVGSYTSFYYKVYEGNIVSGRYNYTVNFAAYDGIENKEDHTYTFGDEPSISSNDYNITVQEQIENANPVSVPFDTVGIKKLVFKTNNSKYDNAELNPTVKYIYVRKTSSTLDWFPTNIGMSNSYFRSNQGSETYNQFSALPSGNSPFSMKTSDKVFTLENSLCYNKSPEYDTTILSLGMQYSSMNTESSNILKVYSPKGNQVGSGYLDTPEINLRSDKLFSNSASQKAILIPYDDNYNSSDSSKYHLVQIVRTKVGISDTTPIYATYLYIDGVLESNNQSTSIYPLSIGKFEFNNVNVSYNLIEIDYLASTNKTDETGKTTKTDKKINVDGLIYGYYLKYKETIQHKSVSNLERSILQQIDNIKFDGKDVIVNKSLVETIVPDIPIPTMMVDFNITDKAEIEKLKTDLFRGYPNGDTAFGSKDVQIYWSDGWKDGNSNDLKYIEIPTMTYESYTLIGKWQMSLQGTSTMQNKIKNFSLKIATSGDTENAGFILTSPNFDPNDGSTFLPEMEWTLKADIADSAHANNTSIGKFVNAVCTPFETGLLVDNNIKKYIKNTLEGFPILMFVKIGEEVYYQGVYNFNLGRKSFYNLGYNTSKDTTNMFNTISQSAGTSFVFARGMNEPNQNLAIGEIQDNFAAFDFHQFDRSVLFAPDNSSRTRMFGKSSKLTYTNLSRAQNTLANFVESVAKAGAYCFANIGKEPVSSQTVGGTGCENRYNVKNQVPDIAYQFKYNDKEEPVWPETADASLTFDVLGKDVNNLLRCISTTLSDGETTNEPFLDYTSASEYYTICMIFGLVDSILKNMNIKSWDGRKCFIAFYDMDCANGENNAGGEDVSYLAATDYWHSDVVNGYTTPVTVDYDYWDNNIGKGFDFNTSYLFAIVKYAKAILNRLNSTINLNYPQNFWAKLRQKDGELRNADYFVDKYFTTGIGEIPAYLASLNYQVKYLYYGTTLNENGEETSATYLANSTAFNGSRIFKVRNWLNKRIHFMDAMFNVQGINLRISENTFIPIPENISDLTNNPDVVLLTDAFSVGDNARILTSNNALPVKITAPLNTPLILVRGSDYMMYLLAGKNMENIIQLTTQVTVSTKFLGSKEFTNVSAIEPFLTSSYRIDTNKLEEIVYSGGSFTRTNNPLTINSASVKVVKLDMPSFSGRLDIKNNGLYGQAIHTINVSGSGFYGEWTNLSALQYVNISSLNCTSSESIVVSGSKLLTGDKFIISGTQENKTYLPTLKISDVSGNFNLSNTNIQSLDITILDGEEGTFEIVGDEALTDLSLTGFKSVRITGCPKLKVLTITESDNNKCETIVINMPYIYDSSNPDNMGTLLKFKSNEDGVFDFAGFSKLDTLGLSGVPAAEIVRIPDKKVKIESLSNNINLEFVDTVGKDSCISLIDQNSFFGSPRYSMRQSWYNTGNGTNITESVKDTPDKCVYTKICIEKGCTTLAHTFDKNIVLNTKYSSSTGKLYKNIWGQNVYNNPIRIQDAKYFINTIVQGSVQGDYYIDENNIIHSSYNGKTYGEDCSMDIISLQGCFKNQKEIFYSTSGVSSAPDLSKYVSLEDISTMYYLTDVNLLSKEILSLPFECNDENHPLNWSEIIKSGEMKITDDAFVNISYRIQDLSSMTLSIYNKDNHSELLENIDIVDVLCPKVNSSNKKILNKLISFNSFNVNPKQKVDYTKMFDVCPNVSTLIGFLNGDLSNAKIDGILKKCEKLKFISDSFSHAGSDISVLPVINLYDFFNWGKNTDMTVMFASSTSSVPGFCLNKEIEYVDFKKILDILPTYTEIERLTNLFSYCKIKNYNGEDIVLSGKMSKIISLNSLFYKCSATDVDGEDIPLMIRRSFFENLPNIASMSNTFYGVHFAEFPTYDFFAKRRKTEDKNVYILNEDNTYTKVVLETYNYNTSELITDMYNCFRDAKFERCACWFNPDSTDNTKLKQPNDVIVGHEDIKTYYKKDGQNYIKYDIETPDAVADTINNFTNYVKYIKIVSGQNAGINNHDIENDLATFGNSGFKDENPYVGLDIVPACCCLPPDIFYACYYSCDLTGVFAYTNIVGTIPQHLLKKCYQGTYKDMWLNTNILPNVLYYYNKRMKDNEKTMFSKMISSIPVDKNNSIINTPKNNDDTTIYTFDEGLTDNDAVVLFRDVNGKLWRRHPRNGDDRSTNYTNTDFSRSQYVYVPIKFAMDNSNLSRAFNFRYNLPDQINLSSQNLKNIYQIEWNEGDYGTSYGPDIVYGKPELWPYYTQYFFLTTESVGWSNLDDFSYPFITDSSDIDYKTNTIRTFSSSEESSLKINKWWSENKMNIDKSRWHDVTNGYFNVFLNLCGDRNTRTGEVQDYGCPINRAIDNRHYPKLDSVVSGILGIFLNGKVFDDGTDAGLFTSLNVYGSKVVIFNGFGRNIILPKLINVPEKDKDPHVVLEYNEQLSQFYEFMFSDDRTLNNYKTNYFPTNTQLLILKGIKFKVVK